MLFFLYLRYLNLYNILYLYSYGCPHIFQIIKYPSPRRDIFSEVSVAIREEGGYQLQPEWGTKPANHYLPRRKTRIQIHEDELVRADNPLKKEHLPTPESGETLDDVAW